MARTLTYERPWLAPYQLEALFCAERYGIVEASTKVGKTAGCMVWLNEQAMRCRPGQNVWWVAPILDTSRIVFDRLRRVLPRETYTLNESKPFIRLVNDVRIWFKGANHPDSLYGDDCYAAVIDEASRMKEEAWHAVRTTLTATRGPLRIIGNVKGRKNWFYRLARIAESGGDPTMHYAKIRSGDAVRVGILNAAEVADARDKLPDAVYRELYEAEPSDDQGNPFGLAAIRAAIAPLSTKPPVVFGLDLAKSHDWCVLIGLDADGAVCRFERWQGEWTTTMARVLAMVGQVPTLIDSTGAGDPVLGQLQKDGVTQRARIQGYVFSAASKQRLMEGLAVAIQQKRIAVPDGPIVAELEAFEYLYTRTGVSYSAPEGLHDDCVCSLALAVEQLRSIFPSLTYSAPVGVTRAETPYGFTLGNESGGLPPHLGWQE